MKQTDGQIRNRRKRDLTREEVDLWRQVTQTIAPFAGRTIPVLPDAEALMQAAMTPTQQTPVRIRSEVPGYTPPVQRPLGGLTPLSPLERRLKQRLSRGREDVDAVMDLHGMRQAEAHSVLRQFLHSAHAGGAKIVLVITGKGRTSAGPDVETGILRRSVPQWLRAPDLRGLIVGFEEASHTHGGAGALYIRIRRAARPQGGAAG
jgi:DNA-nicking Smr family endonuclease